MIYTLKEITDKYLNENDLTFRNDGTPNWKLMASIISTYFSNNNQVIPVNLTGEYVRGRWRKIKNNSRLPKLQREKKKTFDIVQPQVKNELFIKYEYKENRKANGEVEITDSVDKKLTDDEIFERYGRNKNDWRISMVWFKENNTGYKLSVCFVPIHKIQEKSVDYKRAFEDFLNSLNIKVLNRPKIEIPKINKNNKKHCLYLPIFDAHIGKLAHKSTSGDDYDLDIAIQRYKDAIQNLVWSAYSSYNFEEICLVTGSDLLHVDSKTNQTTAGTPQDADSRFEKVYEKTLSLLVETVDFLKSLAPVKLIIVRGNHAEHLEYTVGVALKWLYKNDKEVSVDAEAFLRKYYQYGNTGIMITHGDKEKHDNLPLIFATENKQLWANTEYHQIHLGHLHTDKKKIFLTSNEHSGCQVSIFPSLSGDDYWHSGKGYNLNQKRAVAIVFDKELGEVAKLNYTV